VAVVEAVEQGQVKQENQAALVVAAVMGLVLEVLVIRLVQRQAKAITVAQVGHNQAHTAQEAVAAQVLLGQMGLQPLVAQAVLVQHQAFQVLR
jgi:hypothetical protein